MVGFDRRTFLAGISSLGVTALAGCSTDGGSGTREEDNLSIIDNELSNDGNATISTITIENTGEEELNPTLSLTTGIGPDGLYGEYTDEQSISIAGGDATELELELFDWSELTEVAYNEVENGYFTLTYFINDIEKSHQELGEKSSQYVSFKILYDGRWQGALGTENGQRSISGQGDSHLPVDNDASIVTGNAQKQDGGTITVQILVDGDVISEQSTSAQYGVAQVSESI